MKITVLVDNIGTGELIGEWGLSFYIEYQGKSFLLDAGGSGTFAENARKLGLNLENVDYAVLSHAHYDHADGMADFFDRNRTAKLYLQESCQEDCWRVKEDRSMKYIGIRAGMLEEYRCRLRRVHGDMDICEGVRLVAHHTPHLEEAGAREQMFRKEGGAWVTDCFSHEQSLVFEVGDGIVILNSCSHGGADNIIREVAEEYPGKRIRAMIGGFHLHNKEDGYIRELARRIRKTGVEEICTGHCTGENGYRVLREELGDRVRQLRAGLELEYQEPGQEELKHQGPEWEEPETRCEKKI